MVYEGLLFKHLDLILSQNSRTLHEEIPNKPSAVLRRICCLCDLRDALTHEGEVFHPAKKGLF